MTAAPIAERQPTRTGSRVVLAVLFAVYLALLVWLVMWKFEAPWVADGAGRTVKLVPYVSTATAGANGAREILENVAVFIPFGVYLALLAPKWRWWGGAAAIAGVSVLFEVSQYVLAAGASDTADVIDNTVGGLVGIALVAVIRHRVGTRTSTIVTRICVTGTAIAVVAVTVFVASPVSMGPHHHLVRQNAAPASATLPRTGK